MSIPISTLHELLTCDPVAGKVFWKPRRPETYSGFPHLLEIWNAKNGGKSALDKTERGYKVGKLCGRPTSAHRVIWAMTHGEWPLFIDHINHNRGDNRIANLQSVTRAENQRNLSCRQGVKVTGVRWNERYKCWRAYIGVGGKLINLGTFHSEDNAIKARLAAEKEYGFHPNHGRAA